MNYPFEVRDIASKVERYTYQDMQTWTSLMQINLPIDHLHELTHRRAADRIAHEFAGKVLKHMYVSVRDEPEGRALRFEAFALRYDELLNLLYQAYGAGQSEGMKRRLDIHGMEA